LVPGVQGRAQVEVTVNGKLQGRLGLTGSEQEGKLRDDGASRFELATKYWNDQIDGNEMGGACGTYEKKNACRILAWKPDGKRLLERRRRNEENYIKMEFRVKKDVRVWSGLIWLWTEKCSWLL